MQIEIQIPKAVLFDVKYTVEQATNFAKKEVALGFYMQKGVSVALCSQIAGMSEKEFLVEVKERKRLWKKATRTTGSAWLTSWKRKRENPWKKSWR